MTDDSDDNWLHYEVVSCPVCQTRLGRVDHSPFSDDWVFYCDSCANRVEVSFYDPVVNALRQTPLLCADRSDGALLRAIEERLRACDCGAHFRHDAPRRCHHCNTIVIRDEPWVDLGSHIYDFIPRYRDPTPEEQAQFDAWERTHVRRDDVWR